MAEAAKKTTDLSGDLEEEQGQEVEVAEEETQEEQAEQETVEQASEEEEEQKDEKEEELDQYSKNVRDRISKITQKYRDEEAQRIAAVEFAQKVKQQNDELRDRLNALDQSYVGEFGTRIQSQIDAAKVAYQKAYDEGDADAMFEAQKNLSRLALEEAQVEQAKKRQEQQAAAPKQEQQQQQPQQQAAPKPDPKKQKLGRSKKEWFGQDQTMTYAAFGIHRQLIEDEGFDPTSDEYYSELDRRVRSEFPQKFGGSKDKGPRVASAESTASKSSTKKGRRTVKLTPSQIQIAKRLNVPLEEYAKYVKE